ncbi:hypothetical protein V2W30_32615 [Streptomyces sp. Q6]|uniref:Uncharacterized protein n=1 Tax=Streptomyces citrinus TaxID=3118173 RepID=A0ACD5AKB8_9ACTN
MAHAYIEGVALDAMRPAPAGVPARSRTPGRDQVAMWRISGALGHHRRVCPHTASVLADATSTVTGAPDPDEPGITRVR